MFEGNQGNQKHNSGVPYLTRNQIEREQAKALRVARIATSAPDQTGLREMDTQPQSYLTNYTEKLYDSSFTSTSDCVCE